MPTDFVTRSYLDAPQPFDVLLVHPPEDTAGVRQRLLALPPQEGGRVLSHNRGGGGSAIAVRAAGPLPLPTRGPILLLELLLALLPLGLLVQVCGVCRTGEERSGCGGQVVHTGEVVGPTGY